MAGHIAGTTLLRRDQTDTADPGKVFNQAGLRAANELLVLSLIRAHGKLSKAQIADLSGLTAQTSSVICRSLIEAGLLIAGPRVSGKVGQPHVPLYLDPLGAMFFGLHIEEQAASLGLFDLTGNLLNEWAISYSVLELDQLARFVVDSVNAVRAGFHRDQNERIQGLGVSVVTSRSGKGVFALSWAEFDGAFALLGQSLGLATYVASEAIAACSAEQFYGVGAGATDFVYVYIGSTISGGLVQNGQIRFARDDMGANMGRVLVHGPDGDMVPLRSLAMAAHRKTASVKSLDHLVNGIAYAAHATASVINFDVIIVDGSLDPEILKKITLQLRHELSTFNDGVVPTVMVREGSRVRKHRALGAACLPLADRFFPKPAASVAPKSRYSQGPSGPES